MPFDTLHVLSVPATVDSSTLAHKFQAPAVTWFYSWTELSHSIKQQKSRSLPVDENNVPALKLKKL